MLSRSCVLAAAMLLVACPANTTVPYAIATSPSVMISYPTADDNQICLSDEATREVPVYFTAQNAPTGSQVRVRLLKVDLVTKLVTGVDFETVSATSPVRVPFAATSEPVGRHTVEVEIVHADGTPLTVAERKGNETYRFWVGFTTRARGTTVVSGTAAANTDICDPNEVPCERNDQCDPNPDDPALSQVCNIPNGGFCEAPCKKNLDCTLSNGGYCVVAKGECTPCTVDTQCDSNQYCNADDGTCNKRCEDNADCTGGGICAAATGRCGACTATSQCYPGQVCREEICVLPCDGLCPKALCNETTWTCSPCTADAQCDAVGQGRQVCMPTHCPRLAGSTKDRTCPAAEKGVCEQECWGPEHCLSGETCDGSGHCRAAASMP